MNKIEDLKLEYSNIIDSIKEKSLDLKELGYFIDLSNYYYDGLINKTNKPRLFLLDCLFPVELIKALNIDYSYIFGGSYKAGLINKLALPKKIDDETKSIVGLLSNLNISKNDVLLVPLINDSYRKLKSLLSDSITVITYEVTKDKDRYLNNIKRVISKLKKHFKKHLSLIKLKKECKISKKIAKTFSIFEELFSDPYYNVSSLMYLYIVDSCYICNDRLIFNKHLKKLIEEIKLNKIDKAHRGPKLMMFGSIQYFPNYKILNALTEENLIINKFVYPHIEVIKLFKESSIGLISTKKVCNTYLNSMIYPSISNEYIYSLIKKNKYKALFCIITKGQISKDEQSLEIERYLTNQDISLYKIETTFNNQDIGQIKTKLEAIYEILKR